MSIKSERKRIIKAEKQAEAARQAAAEATRPKVAIRGDEPTVAETHEEITYLQWLLNEHGCPTTRTLICDAALVVDIAHKARHSKAPSEQVKSELEDALDTLAHLVAKDSLVARGLTAQERTHYYFRLTDTLLWFAKAASKQAVALLNEAKVLTPPSLIDMPTQSDVAN